MILWVGAGAVGVLTLAVVVAAGSPSPACLPDGGGSVQPRSASLFAGRSAVDPVHSISLLIMILPNGSRRPWPVMHIPGGLFALI